MMTKYNRVTAKVFASNAASDDIGQFGSALAGTKVNTGDIATIQALPAYETGWRGAVVSTRNYPTLQEMNGLQKTFSYQTAYILQSGMAEWDAGTIYYTDNMCRVGHELYYSLTDNNIGNQPTSSPTYWALYIPGTGTFANQDLSNLTATGEAHFANPYLSNLNTTGNARLHALKAYLDAGELMTDAKGLSDITAYARSTFDASKFTKTGTPTITDNGIASGFSNADYITCDNTTVTTDNVTIYAKFNTGNISATQFNAMINTGVDIGATNNGILFEAANSYNGGGKPRVMFATGIDSTGSTGHFFLDNVLQANTDYSLKIEYKNSSISAYVYDMAGNVVASKTNSQLVPATLKILPSIIGKATVTGRYFPGSIDLKYFRIEISGVDVFSGNKTGVDNYTINSTPVSIPYTLSKTGSKIVDSYYRTRVESVYNEFGCAPYYTLSDTDFTLPMGEIYGMIKNASDGSQCMPSDTYIDLTLGASGSTYTAPANGWFLLDKFATNEQYMYIGVPGYSGFTLSASGNQALCATVPVKKGDVVKVEYNASGTLTDFRFIYAVGAEMEAQ